MLHILLLILKIIGIIIAVILGILLLLICVILFVPVRYEVRAGCRGIWKEARVQTKVSWLLNLVKFTLKYEDGGLKWRLRIAWKVMRSEEEKEDVYEGLEEIPEAEEKRVEEPIKSSQGDTKKAEERSKLPERPEKKYEETDEDVEEKKTFIGKIVDKIKGLYQKIKCTIQGICDKIRMLSEKTEKIEEFLTDETHRNAFVRAKNGLFRLLKTLKPRKVRADIHYGFEDPYRTGQVLAGLGVLYPFLGDGVRITPDFEQKVLEGDLHVKGAVRVEPFVSLILKLILSKEVRATYRHVRNFKL